MTMNRIRSRWTRRTIALLIVLNTAIWASFTLTRRSAPREGSAPSAHRRAARPDAAFDRSPDPSRSATLPRRAPPPSVTSGDYARRDRGPIGKGYGRSESLPLVILSEAKDLLPSHGVKG